MIISHGKACSTDAQPGASFKTGGEVCAAVPNEELPAKGGLSLSLALGAS